MALKSNFSYVKLISPDQYLGYTDSGKINKIVKVFQEAYRSQEGIIVIDNIERLIEYVSYGPRFSNHVLQSLMVLIK